MTNDQQLRVGFATADITPPVGLPMCGSLEPRTNAGTSDPLLVKALVAEAGSKVLAIVGLDLPLLVKATTDQVIREASQRTGIPAEAILLICSHTHSGPYTAEGLYSYGVVDAAYMASAMEHVTTTLAQAQQALRPASMSLGRALVHHGLHHRRVICKHEGKVFNTWMPAALDDLSVCPQILGAAGPIDPELWVVRFDDSAGQPFGALVNLSLHVNSRGGTLWSADYPAVIAEKLAQTYGAGFTTVFTPGACGNVNPTLGGARWRGNAEYFGEQAVAAAQRAVGVPAPVAVDVVRRDVCVPRRDPASQPPDAVGRLNWGGRGGRPDVFGPQLARVAAMADPLCVPVSAARLGPLGIATNGGELFVEWGLDIKARSPFPHTFVTELTNDEIAYEPTAAAFAQQGYETLIGANLVPLEGVQTLVNSAVDLLQELWQRGGGKA